MLVLSPEITSPVTATATAGQPFTYQITAAGNPTGYGANGLPVGLSVDPTTGVISGTPMAVGTFAVGLSAQNAAGTGSATLTLTVSAAVGPTPPPGGSLISAVNLLSPPTNLTVLAGQTINLYVSVDATPGGFKSVEFFAGSTDLGGSQAARDSKTWMPSVPGDYVLQAVATDINGVQTASYEPIHVQAPQANVAAPGAALLSGLDGRSFAQGAMVQLVASATDANGVALQNVQFYADGVLIPGSSMAAQAVGRIRPQDAASGGYYQASLQLGNLIKDTLLTMVATNAQGIASVSQGVTVHTTAAAVGDTLSCAITAPSSTGALNPGGGTMATVSALEPGGSVGAVEFFVNSTSLGKVTAAPYTFTIPPQTAGAYALTAIATDTAGISKVSAPVIVNVTAPTVSLAVSGSTLIPGGTKGVLVVTRTGDPSAPLDVFIKAKGPAVAGLDYKPLPTKVTIPAGAAKAKIKVKTLADPDNTGKRKLKISLLPASDGSYIVGGAVTAKLGIVGL